MNAPIADPARSALRAGIGLRAAHQAEMIERRPDVGWVEAHTENYFARGGVQRESLEEIRNHYRLSLHGVGLSIGSTDALDALHLAETARLIRDFEPFLVSEHLAWGSVLGRFANDLLPMPYTEEALAHMAARVREVQDRLGRRILIENVSSYLQFSCSQIPEWEFLDALAAQSGCGILLDINNVYVNAMNHAFDPLAYLRSIAPGAVGELHLAGHATKQIGEREIRIDTHGTHVCDAVWTLYGVALERFGHAPTLIEWDTNLPQLDVLVAEAHQADRIREQHRARAA